MTYLASVVCHVYLPDDYREARFFSLRAGPGVRPGLEACRAPIVWTDLSVSMIVFRLV